MKKALCYFSGIFSQNSVGWTFVYLDHCTQTRNHKPSSTLAVSFNFVYHGYDRKWIRVRSHAVIYKAMINSCHTYTCTYSTVDVCGTMCDIENVFVLSLQS